MTSRLASRRTVLTAALGSLALAGCSSTSGSSKNGASGTNGSADPGKRLANAQKLLASSTGYHVKLSSNLPSSFAENGIGQGEGDVTPNPSAFKGKVVVLALGSSVNADVICIGDSTWYKTGIQSSYAEFDTSKYGVPQPSRLFSASNGLPALLTKSTNLKVTGKKLVAGQQATMFTGTLDASLVPATIGFGRSRGPYTLVVGLDDQDQPLTMTLTGPFYDSTDASYTIETSKFGEKPSITKPV